MANKNNKKQSSRRVFLALWPDSEARQQIHELKKSLRHDEGLSSASPVDENNIHVTLHFLGSVSENDILLLTQALEGVSENAFEFQLDRLGYFSKPKILWLGCTEQVDALVTLYKSTGRAIKKCFPDYQQKKFLTHVTLFRKAMRLPKIDNIEPIDWCAESFALVESKTYPEGVQYKVLQRWPLMQ